MADESNFQTFKLNLDIKEFTEGALSAKGSIERIGDAQNLEGLVSGLMQATSTVAALGVAAFALKTTFDLVFEGEQIKRTNNLFETLAQNIGVSATAMREDLVKAAHGLADDTEIIQAANRAMVSMGQSAHKMPEVMEAARRITNAFGGDLVERFEQINFAIASGSTRMLRQNGIMIDADKALKDYARGLGVSSDMLTEQGRKQAVMNAVLEYTKTRLGDVKDNTNSATVTMKQLQVQLGQLKEEFVVTFERTAGPLVRDFLKTVKDLMAEFNLGRKMEEAHGPTEKVAVALEGVKAKIAGIKEEIKELESGGSLSAKFLNWTGLGEARVNKLKESLELLQERQRSYEDYLAEANIEKDKQTEKDKKDLEEADAANAIDKKKRVEAHMKMQEEILRMNEQAAERKIEMANSEDELDASRQQLALVRAQEHELRIAQIEEEWRERKITDHDQYVQMRAAIDQQYIDQVEESQARYNAQYGRMLDNQLKQAKTFGSGFSASAKKAAHDAMGGMTQMGKLGATTFHVMQKRGSQMFQDLGRAAVDGSMSASEVMKGFFLNALGDIAQSQGELYLVMGMVPGQQAYLAAGAGLLALSGVLHAMAGSAGGSGGGSIGDYGGGGGGGGDAFSSSADSSKTAEPAGPHKAVSLVVQGNYFETEQTKTRLLDMIRGATDATDFKYVQIGKT